MPSDSRQFRPVRGHFADKLLTSDTVLAEPIRQLAHNTLHI